MLNDQNLNQEMYIPYWYCGGYELHLHECCNSGNLRLVKVTLQRIHARLIVTAKNEDYLTRSAHISTLHFKISAGIKTKQST